MTKFEELMVEILKAEVEGIEMYGGYAPEIMLTKLDNMKKIVEEELNKE